MFNLPYSSSLEIPQPVTPPPEQRAEILLGSEAQHSVNSSGICVLDAAVAAGQIWLLDLVAGRHFAGPQQRPGQLHTG